MVKAFGTTEHTLQILDVVALQIQGNHSKFYHNIEAVVVPIICSPLANQTIDLARDQYPHIKNLDLADTNNNQDDSDVDILIGVNYYWNFWSGSIKRGTSRPVAIETTLGWVLNGPMGASKSIDRVNVNLSSSHVMKVSCITDDSEPLTNLAQSFDKFWEIESTDVILESKEKPQQIHNSDLLNYIENQTKFNGERYEVLLPWKQSHDILTDNYIHSKNRLFALIRRLKKTPELLKEYDDIIKDQEKEGIIEQIPAVHIAIPGHVHYLPHTTLSSETTRKHQKLELFTMQV